MSAAAKPTGDQLPFVDWTVGDYVKLEDPLWPPNLTGKLLGQVESITQQNGAPQHAMIRIKPLLDPAQLREVMVMNKLDVNTAQVASDKSTAVTH